MVDTGPTLTREEHNALVRKSIDFSMFNRPRRSRFHYWWIYALKVARSSWRASCQLLWRFTLSRWLFIKPAHVSPEAEAATMSFVRTHTSIPVPRVWLTFHWWGQPYIIMSRASGTELGEIWETCSLDTKEQIVAQLTNYVGQLRNLKTPYGSTVCSVLRGPVWDGRLYFGGVSGPFVDEAQMNRQLRHLTEPHVWSADITAAHALSHPIMFTHGDLAPRNIMVQDGKVTAILDWEGAGWFPAHWEYCKASFGSFGSIASSWNPWISQFVPPYTMESEANMKLLTLNWLPTRRA